MGSRGLTCAKEAEVEEEGRRIFNLYIAGGSDSGLGMDVMAGIGGVGSDR